MIPDLERATALRAAPLFAQLAADEIMSLARLAVDVTLEPGGRVLTEDEPGEALFVVVRGRVEVSRRGRAIATIGPGEFFGEIALLDEGPHLATVSAVERSELLRVERDDFLDLLSLYPGVGRALLDVLSRRLRGTEVAVR